MAQDNQDRDQQDDRQRQEGQSSDGTREGRGHSSEPMKPGGSPRQDQSPDLEDPDELDDDDDRDDDLREPGSPNRRLSIG